MTVEERLNAVIQNLEASQRMKSNHFTASTLLHLYNIRDGCVPEYMLKYNPPVAETSKKITEHKKLLCGKCAKPLAFIDEQLTINNYAGLCDACFKEKVRP